MLLLIVFINISWFGPHIGAVGPNMLLFWDPAFGATPSGWTIITTYDGKFPRGETPANFGLTGGTSGQTPTTNTITVGAPNLITTGAGTGTAVASGAHTHGNPTVTLGADSNGGLPAYRSYQLMQYNTGIPTSIPAGAIGLFDNSSTLPSGFTRLTANDNAFVRIDSTVATGGADTETNSVSFGALPNSASIAGQISTAGASTPAATDTHGNLAPANGTTTAVSTLPPYVVPLLAQANATTASIPDSFTAMFDADPGVGWVITSNSGGAYYQQMIRPAATPNLTSAGTLTHTPPAYATVSGTPNVASTANTKTNGGGNGAALQTHTHTVNLTFNSETNVPPYFNVVIATKISFNLQAYRWYVDSNAENVTDPWPAGALNLAQNTTLPAVPVPYLAPTTASQLRLRMQILLSGKALPVNTTQFKMQYKQGTDGVCTTGTWTDVAAFGGGGPWTYGSNSVPDGTTLTLSQLTPASSVLERFMKSATSGTNPNGAAVGQTMEYDALLLDNAAADGSQYSFRIIEATGQPLSVYTVCPNAVTKPVISQELRHGEFFQDGSDQGFAWAD